MRNNMRNLMNSSKLSFFHVLKICLVFSLAAPAFPAQSEESITSSALLPRPVISEFVSTDLASERAFSGVIRGQNVTAVAFQTSGRLATLDVEAGDRVAKDQPLAMLDQITLAQDVAIAEAALSAAEGAAEFAQTQYDRIATLAARNVASEAQIESARASRDAARANVLSAEADLTQAREAESYGTLRAPREGIVLETEVEPGTIVSSGISVLTMADPSGREAIIDVPERFAELIPEGAGFIIQHRAPGVPPVAARLDVTEPVAQTGLETRRLRLTLVEPTEDYRIGTLITARYDRESAPVMTLPQSAILTRNGETGVWRIETDRQVAFVPVSLGAEVGDRVIVTGVAEGDEIVTRGVHMLAPGEKVGERLP